MASVTTRSPDDRDLARVAPETIALPLPSAAATVRIEPPRGWLELRLHEVWQYHELLYFFVWRDVKVRYKQTVIGIAWVVLQPLMAMGVFTLFFGHLARLPSQGLPYPVFYFTALVPWAYFTQALSHCTTVVVSNQHVITKVYFPRLILPIAAVCSGLLDFAIGFVVMLTLTLAYGIRPMAAAAVLLPLLIILALLTALGVGLWTSALNALYRDVTSIIPFLIQFWMLASPVAYPSSLVPERWRWLYGLNPMAGVIDGFRWALTGHGQPPGPMMLVSAAMVVVLLIGGLIFFQRMESNVIDHV
jgi:lipopolysaccharide transport system permease protein